jgi:nucleotide-binding universal stress UspA family protein
MWEVTDMFERIVLAVDGSEPSKKAIAVGIDLAKKTDGEIVVVHVHQKQLVTRETDDVETLAEARMITQAVLDIALKAGVKASAELRASEFDDVAREVLAAAEKHQADTIVVGSRGLGYFSELLLGSVAHKVIQLAKCNVVVAR